MNIKLSNKNSADINADILVEFVTPDELSKHVETEILNKAGFKAEQDSSCFLHEKGLLICGVDSQKSDDIRNKTVRPIQSTSVFILEDYLDHAVFNFKDK